MNGMVHVNFKLFPAAAALQAVQVTAQAPVAVNTRTGDQTYSQNEAIAAPSTTTSALIQQSIAGAAKAPTGEVHIRGQHAEYTYYIDGVPVPPGSPARSTSCSAPTWFNKSTFRRAGGMPSTAIARQPSSTSKRGFHQARSTWKSRRRRLLRLHRPVAHDERQFRTARHVPVRAGQGSDMRQDPLVAGSSGDAPSITTTAVRTITASPSCSTRPDPATSSRSKATIR